MHIGDADSFSAGHNFWKEEIPFSLIFLRLIPKKKAKPCPIFDRWRRKMDAMDMYQNTYHRTRLMAGGPDASEKTEGKTPSPTKNKGRKTQTPVWRARGELEPCSLSCSVLNSPWADAGWEERVPLGCGSQTGLVTAAFAFPWPPHSRCCPS